MLKFAHMPTWLVWTLLVALVATRVSGVHLHFCFDGQQPPTSVQNGLPGVDTLGTTHMDKDADMSLVGDASVKNINGNGVLPTLLVAAVLLFIFSLPRKVGFSGCFLRPALICAPGFYLRPPLRGPPR